MAVSDLTVPGYPSHKRFPGDGWCRLLWRLYCLAHRFERWAYWTWMDEHTRQFKEATSGDDK